MASPAEEQPVPIPRGFPGCHPAANLHLNAAKAASWAESGDQRFLSPYATSASGS